MKLKSCKKAHLWQTIKIDGKKYRVETLNGCCKCKKLGKCNYDEGVANQAAMEAVGLINKMVSGR